MRTLSLIRIRTIQIFLLWLFLIKKKDRNKSLSYKERKTKFIFSIFDNYPFVNYLPHVYNLKQLIYEKG